METSRSTAKRGLNIGLGCETSCATVEVRRANSKARKAENSECMWNDDYECCVECCMCSWRIGMRTFQIVLGGGILLGVDYDLIMVSLLVKRMASQATPQQLVSAAASSGRKVYSCYSHSSCANMSVRRIVAVYLRMK